MLNHQSFTLRDFCLFYLITAEGAKKGEEDHEEVHHINVELHRAVNVVLGRHLVLTPAHNHLGVVG